jgi:hypothetical protein
MDRSTLERPAVGYTLLALILAAAGVAAALILSGRFALGGLVTAVCAGAVIVSGRRGKYTGERRIAFADSAAERAADAVILGAVAWATIEDEPAAAIAALAALVFGYLAQYIRAKASGLGFDVEESLLARTFRVGLIVLGLAFRPALGIALWLASGVSLFSVAREWAEVGRQREPA